MYLCSVNEQQTKKQTKMKKNEMNEIENKVVVMQRETPNILNSLKYLSDLEDIMIGQSLAKKNDNLLSRQFLKLIDNKTVILYIFIYYSTYYFQIQEK